MRTSRLEVVSGFVVSIDVASTNVPGVRFDTRGQCMIYTPQEMRILAAYLEQAAVMLTPDKRR